MKNRTQKLVLGIVKTLGITVCVLTVVILIVVSALLYYENHDFSDQNRHGAGCISDQVMKVPLLCGRDRSFAEGLSE